MATFVNYVREDDFLRILRYLYPSPWNAYSWNHVAKDLHAEMMAPKPGKKTPELSFADLLNYLSAYSWEEQYRIAQHYEKEFHRKWREESAYTSSWI